MPQLSRHRLLTALFIALGLASPADAEPEPEQDAEPVAEFETIVIGSRAAIPEPELPLAVAVREPEAIAGARPGWSVAELFAAIPGVTARNRANFAQDLRLSVRGFGARSAFGIRGVTIVLDGVPLTMADGQAQVDVVDPALIDRLEVLRGPAGALFGNGAGGVVYLETAGGDTRPGADLSLELAAFGTRKLLVRGAERIGDGEVAVALSRLDIDGYRQRARVEQTLAHATARWELPRGIELRAALTYVDAPVAQDSGGLTAAELRADPSAAAPNNLAFATGEAVDQGQVGVSARIPLGAGDAIEARAHHVQRNFEGSVPFRFLTLERDATGGGASYRSTRPLAGIRSRLTAAFEGQHMRDCRASFDNDAGMPGGPASSRHDETVRALAGYGQIHLVPLAGLGLLAGARYDHIRFALDDRLLSDGDQSGARSFDAVSGMAGVIVSPRSDLHLYGNVAQSFETPTTTELALRPDGAPGLDQDLSAQRATSYELGARADAGRGGAELTAFRMQLSDELVPFEDETGRTFYRNAGRSHRTGVEASLTLDLPGGVGLRVAYAWLRARFDEYEIGGIDAAGNLVPGLPPHRIGAIASWGGARGPFATVDLEYLDGTYADDGNTARASAHTLLDARAGYRGTRGSLRYQLHLGGGNLAGEVYADNLRVNAVGGRYYEPGLPRHLYAGAILGWSTD